MLATVPGSIIDQWLKYYVAEPWDIPREFWPDVKRGKSNQIIHQNSPDRKPYKQPKKAQLSFFEGFIQRGRIIDVRGGKTPTA